jgi:DNA-binding response OmpR family regulator
VIEDSPDARERLRIALEHAGHMVYDAADVERGLKLLKTVRPDVGIIDISAPLVDRARVARRFRKARHGHNMVLVALGLPAALSAGNGASDGFDYHLAKPVDAERLAILLGAGATQTGAARQ